MIKRWDCILYRNEFGSGAKIEPNDTGEFVKWKDVKDLIESAQEAERNEGIVEALRDD